MTHLEEVAMAQLTHERDDLLIQLANTAAERDDLRAELERYDRQRFAGHP
jgi:hypothetical protein